ncbi:MAG: hypothetical protein LBQ38_09130 [Spirochaetaceae bacterium]|nr:hypothetical protein [Spirochaetaceae bacterium]
MSERDGLPLKSSGAKPGLGIPGSLRSLGLLAAWIAGILVLGGLTWFFTQPVRDRMLLYSVNRVLAASDVSRRLGTPISPWRMPGRATQFGSWFTLAGSGDWGVVFPIMINGIPASFFAAVSPEGAVGSLVPLSGNAVKALKYLPPGALGIYIRRIEVSNALLRDTLSDLSQGRIR